MEKEETREERIAINQELLNTGQSLVREDGNSRTTITLLGRYFDVIHHKKSPILGSRGIKVGEKWVINGGADYVDTDLLDLSDYRPIEESKVS